MELAREVCVFLFRGCKECGWRLGQEGREADIYRCCSVYKGEMCSRYDSAVDVLDMLVGLVVTHLYSQRFGPIPSLTNIDSL